MKPLPHDSRAERVVLSGLLREPELNAAAFCELAEQDFYFFAHRLVFAAALELWSLFRPVDMVEVYLLLRSRRQLADLGGRPGLWLAGVYETDPVGCDCLRATHEVAGLAARRRAILHHREVLGLLERGEPVPA